MKKITMLAALFSATLTGFAQVTHDLQLSIDFENGITDASTQNHATAIVGTTVYANDQWNTANGCIRFSGNASPGEVQLTNTNGSYKVNFPATISAWVNINSFGTAASPIVTTEDHPGVYSGLWLEVSNTGGVITQYGDGGLPGANSRRTFTTIAGIVSLSTWNHIVAVYNSANSVSIYVNGVLYSTTPSGTGAALVYVNGVGTVGKIGSYLKGSASRTLNGTIDKLKIYNAALTESEVLALYYTNHVEHSTLLFNYKMNAGFNDASIYNQTSGQIGTCLYGTDRFANPSGALNCSTTSAVEIQEANGNFKTGFPMTFAAWISVNALGTSQALFANNDRNNAYSGVIIQLTATGNVAINVGDGTVTGATGRRTYVTNSTITAGNWTHIAVILKPAAGLTQYTATVYFNGVAQTMSAQSGTGGAMVYNTTGTVYGKIGAYNGGTASLIALNGLLDDVMFWDEELSANEVMQLAANAGNSIGITESLDGATSSLLFPNPASTSITIEIQNDLINQINIIDLTGKMVLTKNAINTQMCRA
jgi:Concanavalin A-like lectin/glucanases superfamily